MTIHLYHQGRQLGAFSQDQVEAMLKGSVISGETLAWTTGQAGWKLLREILSPPIPPPFPLCTTTKPGTPPPVPTPHEAATTNFGSFPTHSNPTDDTSKNVNVPPVLRRPVPKQIHPVLAYLIPIGRINRSMWFASNLINLIVPGSVVYLAQLLIGSKGDPPDWVLVSLAVFVLYLISVTAAKRLHDMNASAWFFFIVFIPLVPLFLLVLSGTKGPNKYGPEP